MSGKTFSGELLKTWKLSDLHRCPSLLLHFFTVFIPSTRGKQIDQLEEEEKEEKTAVEEAKEDEEQQDA